MHICLVMYLHVLTSVYRYISRNVLIEFGHPCLDISMVEFRSLPLLLKRASSAVGHIIRLGKLFVEQGVEDMESTIKPELIHLLGHQAIPQVIPSYTILMWFTFEV